MWKLVKGDSRRYTGGTGEEYTSSATRMPLEGDYNCAADFRHRTWLLTSSGFPPPVQRSDSALPPIQRHQLSAFKNLIGHCRLPNTCFFTFTNLTPFREGLEPTMFVHFFVSLETFSFLFLSFKINELLVVNLKYRTSILHGTADHRMLIFAGETNHLSKI